MAFRDFFRLGARAGDSSPTEDAVARELTTENSGQNPGGAAPDSLKQSDPSNSLKAVPLLEGGCPVCGATCCIRTGPDSWRCNGCGACCEGAGARFRTVTGFGADSSPVIHLFDTWTGKRVNDSLLAGAFALNNPAQVSKLPKANLNPAGFAEAIGRLKFWNKG